MIIPPTVLAAIHQPAFVYGREGVVEAANNLAETLAGQPLAGRSAAEVGRIFQYRHADGPRSRRPSCRPRGRSRAVRS